MDTLETTPYNNRLLDLLPPAACARLKGHLRDVPLPVGKILHESGAPRRQLYFPRSGIVSLLYAMDDGDSVQVSMVGNEGAVGCALVLHSQSTPARTEVLAAGHALALDASVALDELDRGGEFRAVMLRYIQALIVQMSQSILCTRRHIVEQQLCRWLLRFQDRIATNSIPMTQEQIADTLGVRRESVSAAAGQLQSAGLIRYSRGNIQVLDRTGLLQRCCGCYRLITHEYDRLLKHPVLPGHASPHTWGRSEE